METISLLSGVLLFSVLCLLPEVRANNCDWLLPDDTRIRMRMQHNFHLDEGFPRGGKEITARRLCHYIRLSHLHEGKADSAEIPRRI